MKLILNSILTILIVLLYSLPAVAENPRSAVSRGIKHYEDGEYDKALTEFLAGQELRPDDPNIKYNLGTALYKMQDAQKASELFQKAATEEDPKIASNAWYNLGNTLVQGQDYENAVNAYKNSLILDPNDQDAKYNLERALQMMTMQQQQQQQQKSSQQDSSGQQQQQDQQQAQQQQQQDEQEQEQDQQQQQQQNAGQDSTQQAQSQPRETEMTPEEAEQLLQALEADEQEAQKERLKRMFANEKDASKDW